MIARLLSRLRPKRRKSPIVYVGAPREAVVTLICSKRGEEVLHVALSRDALASLVREVLTLLNLPTRLASYPSPSPYRVVLAEAYRAYLHEFGGDYGPSTFVDFVVAEVIEPMMMFPSDGRSSLAKWYRLRADEIDGGEQRARNRCK